MKKAKSLSLSEKDRNKIIDIIHSKITPLKFKYKKFQRQRQLYLNASLPKLSNQNENTFGGFNKRISISTYIEKSQSKIKNLKQKQQNHFRKQILDTQNLANQHQFLTKQLILTAPNFYKQNPRVTSTLKQYGEPFPIQKKEKILSDFLLLQKKKKLKNIKSQINYKKNKLFDQVQNLQRQKRQEETLHKKYQRNSRQFFKQKFIPQKQNFEIISINQNLDDGKRKLLKNSALFKIDKLTGEKIDQEVKNDLFTHPKVQESGQSSKKELIDRNQQNSNKIKDYLKYFKKTNSLTRYFDQNKQQKQSYIFNRTTHLTQAYDEKSTPFNQIISEQEIQEQSSFYSYPQNFFERLNRKDRELQKGIINLLEQKDKKNITNESAFFEEEIKNARMRMKFNHKKIINIRKMQKNQ